MYRVVVLCLLVHCLAAPTTKKDEDCDSGEVYEEVDQRQNGTENYRVNINGVVVMWAPAQTLLTAAQLLGDTDFDSEFEELDFLQTQKPTAGQNPQEQNSLNPSSTTNNLGVTKRPEKIKGFVLPLSIVLHS